MKPLFFPYTYVMEPTINAYRFFFSGLSVLQSSVKHLPEPMAQWAAQDFLDIQLPDPTTSRIFDKILAETENWVRSHRGGAAAFLKGYHDGVPFFESSSVSQITQDIRAAGRPVSPDASQQDALLRARIFLQIAQEFDAHNQWLSHQLEQQEAMERNLYRELRGDERSPDRAVESGQPWENAEPFQYMMLERLKAWSRVMLSHGRVRGPLVTTTASVLTLIQEHVPDIEELFLAGSIPAINRDAPAAKDERQDLMDYCEKLVHTPVSLLSDSGLLGTYPAETTATLSLKLYLLPGIAPQSLLTLFVDGNRPGDRDAAGESNTLIGYIEDSSQPR
jgi:hypothetical protein